jgi:CheY-like chemotaxis protein
MTTIAVLEDDPALLHLMQELFDERDWVLLPMHDPSTVVEMLGHTQPDAVLLDIHPDGGQSGWQMLEAVRAHPSTSIIPIVVWSGDVRGLQERRPWLEAQGIPVVSKPFDIDELYRSLDHALDGHQVQRDESLTA